MADNKIIFDAGLRLGIDEAQLKSLQKLIEKSLKADLDITGVKRVAGEKGLKVAPKSQALLDQVLKGSVKVQDLTKAQQKQVAQAYGQLARQLENSRKYYSELDKLARGTGLNIESAMASLKRGIENLANQVNAIKPQINQPRVAQQAVNAEQARANRREQVQARLRARMERKAQEEQDRALSRAAAVESKVASVLDQEPARRQKQYRPIRQAQEARQEAVQRAQVRYPVGAKVVQDKGLRSEFRGLGKQEMNQTRAYLQAQLSSVNALQRSLAKSLGTEAEETKRATAQANAYSKALANVAKQQERLRQQQEKNRNELKSLRTEQAKQDKAVKGSRLAQNLKQKTQYQTVVGPRGYGVDLTIGARDQATAAAGRDARIERMQAAQEEEARKSGRLLTLQQKYKARQIVEEEKAAKRARDFDNKLAAANDRAAKQAQADADKKKKSADALALAEHNYARALKDAAARFPRGAKIAASGKFSDLDDTADAAEARKYLGAAHTAARGMEKRYSAEFGKDSAQAKAAAAEARNYAAALGQVSTRYGELTAKGHGLSNTFKSFTRYALGYGALYEVLNGVTALIGGVVQLDQDLKSIQAVSLSTDKQMESLAGSIERVALNTKFSNAEIADAVRTLVQAGTAAEDINAVVQATANFASATNSSLQVAADLITSARSVFDDLSDNTIANQLTSAVNISKLQAEDLQTIVSLGAQVANSYKITSDQFLAAVSTLRNVGIKPSIVATGLRQAMLEVFSPDEKTIEVMRSRYQALGEEMSAEAIRSRFSGITETDNPMVSALGELKRLGFAGEAQQDFARNFDVRAYNPLLALVKNYDQLLANEAKITFGAPAAEAAAIQKEALTAKVENLGGAITALASSMSGGLVKSIGEAVDAATSGVESIRRARAETATGVDTQGGDGLVAQTAKAADFALKGARYVLPGLGQAAATYDVVESVAGDKKKQRAEKSADVSAKLNYQLEDTLARIQTFEEAASAFDVNAARAGKAAGKSSEAILGASEAVSRMEQGISELFSGTLPEVNQQLLDTVAAYSKMGSTQRKAKFDEMKLESPELEQFSFSQFDIRMNAIATESSRLSSYLEGMSSATLETLIRYNDIVAKAQDKSEEDLTALDVQARAFLRQYEENSAYRDVVLGTSGESKDQQLVIFQNAMQAISDEITAFQTRVVGASVDRLRNAALSKDIERALDSPGGIETAKVQIKAAITSLFKSIDGVGFESRDRIKQVEKTISDTAKRLRAEGRGAEAAAVETFSGAPGEEVARRKEAERAEVTARVTDVRQNIAPAMKEANFQKFISEEAVTLSPSQRKSIKRYQDNPDSFSLEMAARQNTQVYKDLKSVSESYQNSERRRLEVEELVNSAMTTRASLEERLADVDQKINEKKAAKDFTGLSSLRDEQASLKTQVVQRRIAEETKDLNVKGNLQLEGPQGTRARDKIGSLQRDLLKIQTDNEKAKQQDLLEEGAITRESRQRTLELIKSQAEENLNSAIFLQDESSIEKFKTELDATNAELLELFKQQLVVEGVHGELFNAEVAAKTEELKKTEEHVSYMERVYAAQIAAEERRLQSINNQINEIESTAPGRGGRRYDAMLRSQGLTPSKDEKAYNQQATQAYGKYQGELEGRQQTLQDREARLKSEISVESDPKKLEELNLQLYDTQDQLSATRVELAGVNQELADLNYQAETLNGKDFKFGDLFQASTWKEGLSGAGTLLDDTFNSVSEKLASSKENFANWTSNVSDIVAGTFESVGDVVTDSLLDMEESGMSFSDAMRKTFSQMGKDLLRSLMKTMTNKLFTQLFSMIGGGPAGGLGSMAASFLGGGGGAKEGGIVKLASGGIIRGRGTGTSDSIPGVILGRGGKRKPVALSNGESVLNARATSSLGSNFVHAANSGSLFKMAEGGMVSPATAESVNMVNTVQKESSKQGAVVAQAMQQAPIQLTVNNLVDADSQTSAGLKKPSSRNELFNAVKADKSRFQALLNN